MTVRLNARHTRRTWKCPVALMLVVCLLAGTPMLAERPSVWLKAPAGAAQDAIAAPRALHIAILEGEGALNNVRDRTAREPIVQVQDENHKPVAGALVLFTLHEGSGGAGGVFGNGAISLSVTTGADGRAVAQGLQINQVPGSYTITVEATYGALEAVATIQQTNTSSSQEQTQTQQPAATQPVSQTKRSLLRSVISRPVLLAAAGAGAVIVVVVLATRSKGTTITAGTATVGPAVRQILRHR